MPQDNALLSSLTVGEFRSLLRDFAQPAKPPLATQSEAAAALGLSVRSLSNFEQRGMPVLRVNGCAPKYDLGSIRTWLSAQSAREKAESEHCDEVQGARLRAMIAEQSLSYARAHAEKMIAEGWGTDEQRARAAAIAERSQVALERARAELAQLENDEPAQSAEKAATQ